MLKYGAMYVKYVIPVCLWEPVVRGERGEVGAFLVLSQLHATRNPADASDIWPSDLSTSPLWPPTPDPGLWCRAARRSVSGL